MGGFRRPLRTGAWLATCNVLVVMLGACSQATRSDDLTLGRRYVEDASFRRQVLEASLVNPSNGYSRLRLTQYGPGGWDELPEWNPAVEVPLADGSKQLRPSLDVEHIPWQRDALIALGREAFFRYPVQLLDAASAGLRHPQAYGLWQSREGVGGLVLAHVPAGPPHVAITCATCHAEVGPDGAITAGRPNARLRFDALLAGGMGGPARTEWGPGRVDVTADGIDNPIAIPDLRPIRSQQFLHHDATVRNGLIELAIRIETLIITSNGQAMRPPRKLAFALALYLWSLAPTAVDAPSAASMRGERLFADHCAHCHQPPEYSGGRLPLQRIGTDPLVGEIPDRTTGTYRIPSLRGVGDRELLLAAGQVSGLEQLLDPHRTVRGHRYGLDLPESSRSDLIAFLRTLH